MANGLQKCEKLHEREDSCADLNEMVENYTFWQDSACWALISCRPVRSLANSPSLEVNLVYIDAIKAAVPANIPAQLVQIAAFRVLPIDEPASQTKIGAHMMHVSALLAAGHASPWPTCFSPIPRRNAGASEPAKISPETPIPYKGEVWPTR